MAKAKASANKPRSKSEIFSTLAEETGLTRRQVSQIFDSLTGMMKKDLSRGPGIFAVPGLMKITVLKKPATKEKKVPNPFKPGEMMVVKAKPARKVVKVRPLKGLKAMV